MGANMTRRLMRGKHEIVVTDLSAENVKRIAAEGAISSVSLDDFVSELQPPPELPAVPAPKSDTAPDWIRSRNQRYCQLYRAA